MFQNKSQLNTAMKEILSAFQQGNDISDIYLKYSDGRELDLIKAVGTCLAKGYLTGVSYKIGTQNNMVISLTNPHVTASGVEFIAKN